MDIKVTLKQMNNGRIDARVNNRKALKLKAGFHTISMIAAIVECVTCYVKCVTASSDTALYAGMSCELNHVLEGCYEKFGTCALE